MRILTARQSEVALRGGVPALCHCEDDRPGKEEEVITMLRVYNVQSEPGNSPRLVYNLSQYPHRIVVTHVLKINVIHLIRKTF